MKNKIIYGCIVIIVLFFVLKRLLINNYDKMPAKVIDIETIMVKKCVRNRCQYIKLEMPVIEFYLNNDRVVFEYGKEPLFETLNKNEVIEILIDKENKNNIIPNALFYYWLTLPDLILIGLVSFIYTGTIKVFFNDNKKNTF